jgi:enhancing lycopene biosynthesis protein 2
LVAFDFCVIVVSVRSLLGQRRPVRQENNRAHRGIDVTGFTYGGNFSDYPSPGAGCSVRHPS